MVKGTIDQEEKYDQAAIRELFEETGLNAEPNPKFIGNFKLKSNQQNWYSMYAR
ncbi:NUDIX domain protein [Acinetobacter sp. 1000160]|nr:NUDIX domain protein [Acinetobacter baumannii 146457]EYT21732.1 NUDIX domain protein [Acinetobacter sp. 1000160]